MILVVTHRHDFTADFVIDKLNQKKIDYRRLNCEDIDRNSYSVKTKETLSFNILGCQEFKSVWFRRTRLPSATQGLTPDEQRYIQTDYYSLIQNLMLCVDGKWLSHPSKVYQAENKLFQLKVASRIGFKVPETIVSNNHTQIEEFCDNSQDGVIMKPINSSRLEDSESQKLIFTNLIPKRILSELRLYALTPAIFQKNIIKAYEVRVTVIGDNVFSAKVMSQEYRESTIDWRRKKLPFEPYKLPVDIEKKCVDLVKALGLGFGAIDIIKAIDEHYYFLEINPNGQWVWIETETNHPISDAVISYLND